MTQLLFPGENTIHCFFAEVRQTSYCAKKLYYCISATKDVDIYAPGADAFTAQILLTNARMLFFQPTNKDIEQSILRYSYLYEVIYYAFFIQNVYKIIMPDDCQIYLQLLSPCKIVLSIPKANSWRIVTQYLTATLFCYERSRLYPWDFAFTYASALQQRSGSCGYPDSIKNKPIFGYLVTRWNSYFECYQSLQAVDRDTKQIESLLNSPIASDAFLELSYHYYEFQLFGGQIKTTALKAFLPLQFLLKAQRKAAPLILSLANANYYLCPYYSALFVTPNVNLSKPYFYSENRFPIVAFGRVMRSGYVTSENTTVNGVFQQTLQMLGKERLIVFDLGKSNMTFGQLIPVTVPPIEQVKLAFSSLNSFWYASEAAVASSTFTADANDQLVERMTMHYQRMKIERDEKALVQAYNSHWTRIVNYLLKNARELAFLATDPRLLILVSGSEERYYGSVLICLAEIMLNAEARTARGFSKCIRKHLEHPGFDFQLELFMLLLDAVSHLVQTQAYCFALSDAFLARYALIATSRQYGNFLMKNECERVASGTTLATVLLDAQFEVDFEGKLDDVDLDSIQGFVNISKFWSQFY